MELAEVFQKVGIALGLGLLVGMQRERVKSPIAGIRTMALVTVFGAVTALLGIPFGGWVVGLGAVAVAAMLVIGNVAKIQSKKPDPGLTTEIATLLMYGVGAYTVVGHEAVAVAIGGGVAVLLHFKEPLHALVAKIGEQDLKAIMQLVLIALVILPVLPDQNYGPYQVWSPRKIWFMVVLIVGISLGGYIAYKLFGETAGTLLGGILGGLISSTATTVSYARRTHGAPESAKLAALVILIASTVAIARVLVEVAVVAPGILGQVGPPLGVLLAWMALLSGGMYFFGRGEGDKMPEQENPAELKAALIFGAIYAAVILAVAAANDFFGSAGLYVVGILSGLTDMDAITLSTAQLVDQQQVTPGTGWRVILIAALSNLVFKAGAVAVLGDRRLLLWIAGLFGLAIAGGLVLLFVWPAETQPPP
jgi:uncharacterized membrane protein (DUF4010 family)